MNTLGKRLVKIRKEKGLTQKRLAELLDITPTRLNYWEKDKREPDISMIKKISEVLQIDPNFLIGLNFWTEDMFEDYRNAKNALGVWEKVPYYAIDDTIPYGHGEKSVMMITEYMKLTPEEKYCIRWHMGFTEPKEQYTTIGLAYKKYPLALLVHEADLESTYFYNI